MSYDIIVRGGTVVDGSGLPGYRADLGIRDGMIAAIGDLKGESARETIDAEGSIVAPGFIDAHTHMDAQIFWDPLGNNSCWHGVTSVVMGNCGFSLAPCAEKDKLLVINNLERAEDISPEAMQAGIAWSWESYPQYLDAVDRLPKGINYAGYVGHSALRTHVMGKRGAAEAAGPDDIERMKKELEASLCAGAIGFSTSCTSTHRTPDGNPVASRFAEWSEIEQLVGVMARLGSGVFEIAREPAYARTPASIEESERLKKLAIDTKVPITFGNPWYSRRSKDPEAWRAQIAMCDDIAAAGGKVLIQGSAGWHGSMRSFETLLPFDKAPVWSEFRKLPLDEQKRQLRDPHIRQTLVDAANNFKHKPNPAFPNALNRTVQWDWFFPLLESVLPPYKSVGEIAREQNKDPIDVMIDLSLDHDLKLFFVDPSNNEDHDVVLAMIRHPNCAVTFTDAGAHVATTLNPVHTFTLGHWVRNMRALTVEAAIRKITFDITSFWGIRGRGLLREGYHADVCIFDLAKVNPHVPQLVHDVPTGAPRLLQKADGIRATIVNGTVLLRDGAHTGALPGRVLRGSLASN
jgi:N-acyl-D-aspartate/D-glutamate deacylase